MTESPRAVPATRTVASALHRLRQFILTGELQPNEQIRQEEMAARLGISRVPLREALRVLASEGMLTHRPHQGYFVAKLSSEDLDQVFALLEFLETELLRTVRWPTDDEILQLRDVNDRFAMAAERRDVAEVNRTNHELHKRVFWLSPLDVYQSEWTRFWAISDPYRFLHLRRMHNDRTQATVAVQQHEQLIDALAAHDVALSLRTMAMHRRDSHDAVLEALGTIGRVIPDLATEPGQIA